MSMPEQHTLLGGKVYVYKRPNSKTILEVEVRGKRGVGYCKSMPGAVRRFERLRSQLRPARIDGVSTPEKSSVTSAAANAADCRRYGVGRRGRSEDPVPRMVFEKFALPVRKNEGSGFGHAPWFASMETSPTSGASIGRGSSFRHQRSPSRARAKSCSS